MNEWISTIHVWDFFLNSLWTTIRDLCFFSASRPVMVAQWSLFDLTSHDYIFWNLSQIRQKRFCSDVFVILYLRPPENRVFQTFCRCIRIGPQSLAKTVGIQSELSLCFNVRTESICHKLPTLKSEKSDANFGARWLTHLVSKSKVFVRLGSVIACCWKECPDVVKALTSGMYSRLIRSFLWHRRKN